MGIKREFEVKFYRDTEKIDGITALTILLQRIAKRRPAKAKDIWFVQQLIIYFLLSHFQNFNNDSGFASWKRGTLSVLRIDSNLIRGIS